jgi:hypothetical protein
VHVIAFVAGAGIVATMLWDAFETLVLPRGPRRRFRVTRLFYRSTWRLWVTFADVIASPTRRHRYLAVYGPLSVFLLVAVWASMLVVGFALLQWSQRELLLNVDGTAHFSDDLYMSATTLFALGLGDVAPEGRVGRLLVVAETGSSVMLISMLFSYIPIVYQSFARRELRVTQLDAWAGSPPTATELLRRLAQSGDVSRIERVLSDWENWCADLLESHLSYPAIGYFRSPHHRQSWLAALTTVLDLTALVKVGIEGLPVWPAHVTFAIARHAAVDLAHVLGGPAPSADDRLRPLALAEVRADLEAVGLRPNRTCTADRQLAELRTSYEPYIAALSARLMMPCPGWRPAPCSPCDNWETDPARDGGPHF